MNVRENFYNRMDDLCHLLGPRAIRVRIAAFWAIECQLRISYSFRYRIIVDHDATLYPWAKTGKPTKDLPFAINHFSMQ